LYYLEFIYKKIKFRIFTILNDLNINLYLHIKMAITMVPAAGSVIKNFQIVDTGGIYDDNLKVIKQGKFLSGKLNGPDCVVTSYGGSEINIRKGAFSAGVENGSIFEYVFVQSDWELLFGANSSISVTRYSHVFANGVWQSTSATNTVKITGTRTFNTKGYLVGFTFMEV
jgi:hypothetical protein